MDDAEEAFGVGAKHSLRPADGFNRKGMYNLYPPFAEFRIASFHALDILFWVFRVDQGKDNIFDDKPPLVVVKGFSDFVPFKQGEFCDFFCGHELYPTGEFSRITLSVRGNKCLFLAPTLPSYHGTIKVTSLKAYISIFTELSEKMDSCFWFAERCSNFCDAVFCGLVQALVSASSSDIYSEYCKNFFYDAIAR